MTSSPRPMLFLRSGHLLFLAFVQTPFLLPTLRRLSVLGGCKSGHVHRRRIPHAAQSGAGHPKPSARNGHIVMDAKSLRAWAAIQGCTSSLSMPRIDKKRTGGPISSRSVVEIAGLRKPRGWVCGLAPVEAINTGGPCPNGKDWKGHGEESKTNEENRRSGTKSQLLIDEPNGAPILCFKLLCMGS